MQGMNVARALAQVDIFAGLPRPALESLAASVARMDFQPGDVVTEQGADEVTYFLVTDGSVDIFVNGTQHGSLNEGEYFGEIALLDRRPRSATVKAGANGAKLVAVSALAFGPLLEDASVAQAMLKVVCARLRRTEEAGWN